MKRRLAAATALTLTAALLGGCAAIPEAASSRDRIQVVTTTGILADLVRNIAGDQADVVQLVPDGADPHSYEPTLRDVRDVVYSDLAFTNYLMLEEQRVISTIDANLPEHAVQVSLAEEAVKYAAEVIPLVEDVSLDSIWLGFRASGGEFVDGIDRSSKVELSTTGARGPGALHAYLTGSFGDVERYFDSSDGADPYTDRVTLPADAHTHLSWTFTAPGYYELDLKGELRKAPTDDQPEPVATGTLVFAVGVDPYSAPNRPGATVLDAGHADIDVSLENRELRLLVDRETNRDYYGIENVVISVPNSTLVPIPADPGYRFLGHAGSEVFQLPQAVLGKHVHGEIDPHLWHDVSNVIAYVQIIRDKLIEIDPANASAYARNAAAYIKELEALDDEMRSSIEQIPESRRTLITTHDSFAYLAKAYELRVAGFVTPNPATEPSLIERRRLGETIENLHVPAVFLEPNLAQRSSTLNEIAKEKGVRVCPILGDSFIPEANTYIKLMRFNAHSLVDCLGE